MKRWIGRMRALLPYGVLLVAIGCSSQVPVAEVEGIVKLSGKPLSHVRLVFMPDPQKGTRGPVSAGTTDEQGHFHLTCEDERPGAVVGWHRVIISDMKVHLPRAVRNGRRDDDDPQNAIKGKIQASRVPEKYTMAGHSPLEIEVKAEKNNLPIDLSR